MPASRSTKTSLVSEITPENVEESAQKHENQTEQLSQHKETSPQSNENESVSQLPNQPGNFLEAANAYVDFSGRLSDNVIDAIDEASTSFSTELARIASQSGHSLEHVVSYAYKSKVRKRMPIKRRAMSSWNRFQREKAKELGPAQIKTEWASMSEEQRAQWASGPEDVRVQHISTRKVDRRIFKQKVKYLTNFVSF